MKGRFKHQLLLLCYHFLIALKKILWSTGLFLFPVLKWGWKGALAPLTLSLYRTHLFIRHKLELSRVPLLERMREFGEHPHILLLVIVVVAAALLVPHTTLVGRAQVLAPERESILLHLLGPGEEYFEEETIESPAVSTLEKWDAGAARARTSEPSGETPEAPELGAIAVGGTALTKPTLLPGAFEGRRTEIINYTVRAGDTVSTVAQAFGISVNTVLWENNLSFYSYIRPGQVLRILPVSGVSHKVKKGETLQKIAKNYKVAEEDILNFNRVSDAGRIAVGDLLIIPGGKKEAPSLPSRVAGASSRLRGVVVPPPSLSVPAGTQFIWPTSARRITQYFTWRHSGVDIAGPLGTPVYASRAGRVIHARCGWEGGYGCNIRIDHGDGIVTLYAHNSLGQHFVKVGDFVEQGQTIAGMGSTGRSTGSHVHFEIRVNGVKVNPLRYIR